MKSVVTKEEQFITNAEGKRVGVLLSLKAYQDLCEAQEDLADIEAYDAVRAKTEAEVASGQFATLTEYRSTRSRKRK